LLAQDGADPGPVDGARVGAAGADHDAGVGGVVADGVEHLAHRLGVAVELLDAGVDDLDGGRDVVGSGQHLLDVNMGAAQVALEHEGQFDLDARRDEAAGGNLQHLARRAGEQHESSSVP
jgi:hypothetical protein